MKRMKKIVSILLAVVMVLGMSMTVFATEADGTEPPSSSESGELGGDSTTNDNVAVPPTDNTTEGSVEINQGNFSLTIADDTEGYTYVVYQIFKGNLLTSNGVKTLSNIEWGDSIDVGKAGATFTKVEGDKTVAMTASEVAESISSSAAANEFDTEAAKKFATQIAKCIKNATTNENGDVILPEASGKKAEPNESKTAYVATGLTAGYYMVANTSVPAEDAAFTRYMLNIVGDVTATPKADIPTTDKKILELKCTVTDEGHSHTDDCYERVSANEASIGDDVKYEITGTMPKNIADYKTYFYQFTDTLSEGLTFKGTIKSDSGNKGNTEDVVVKVNGADVSKYFYKNVTVNQDGTSTIEVSIKDLKALSLLKDPAVGEIKTDTIVVVTYTATLNEKAVIAGEGNPNDVKLDYSNDPNNSGNGSTEPPENPDKPTPEHPTGETPEVEVVTYTTELTILKKNEIGAFLPGVEFTLTGNGVNIVLVTEETFTEAADGEYWKLKDGTYTTTAPTTADDETNNTADYDSVDTKYTKTTSVVAKGNGETKTDVVGTVQEDGKVTFRGLGAGEYTITETKTLPGYNTIDPITFTLTFDKDATPMFTSNNNNVTVGADNMLDTSIVNQKGSLLPSTGGIGTTIFYVVGACLVIGAGILLVVKKRMSKR